MASVDARVAEWVDIIADLLSQPLTSLPAERITIHLLRSFDADVVSYNWRKHDGAMGVEGASREGRRFDGMDLQDALTLSRQVLHAGGLLDYHPLVRWFAVTGIPSAQTMGRVPMAVAHTRRLPEVLEIVNAWAIPQQMSLPVLLDGVAHKAFVPGRAGREDFSAEDLTVAHRVQVMLIALNRQCEVLASYSPPPPTPPKGLLTGRELAVLRLVAEGWTATAIGRRLTSSPRTVHKHIENTYRKLGVRDRVTAVRVAEAAGLVSPPAAADFSSRTLVWTRRPNPRPRKQYADETQHQ